MSVQSIGNPAEWKAAIKSCPRVVIDCYGDFCGPCKKIAPQIAQLAKEHKNIRFFKANEAAEELGDLFQSYGVQSLPTFLFFSNSGRWEQDLTVTGGNLAAVRSSLDTLCSM